MSFVQIEKAKGSYDHQRMNQFVKSFNSDYTESTLLVSVLTSNDIVDRKEKSMITIGQDLKESFIDEIFSTKDFYFIAVISKFTNTTLLKCLSFFSYDKVKETLRSVDFEGIPIDSPISYS